MTRKGRIFRRKVALFLGVALGLGGVAGAQAPGQPVRPAVTPPADVKPLAPTLKPSRPAGSAQLPNLWDPKRRPEKPTGDLGTIRFLTSGDFPPFNYLDSGGRLTGFNIDLARAICAELTAACTIQMRPFDDLVTAIGERRGDAIVAGLNIGADLRTKLETTDAYLTMPGRFVAPKGTALTTTPEGLELRWISVVSGSAHEAFVLDSFPKSRVVAYPNEAAARDALRDGTVDVHFGDAVGLSFWLLGEASHNCCEFRGAPYLESNYFGDGLRISVTKGNKRLKQAFDYALHRLSEDGTIAELYFRYFPLGYY